MTRLLKEPLLHFLAAGFLLFLIFDFTSGDASATDPRVINVDRNAMLTFLQFRTRAFEPELASRRLDEMPADELEALIDAYVREEALYREALALGMDKNDYIIKQRMIQSISFVTNGFVSASVEVTDDEVRTFFEANADDFYRDPTVTFTHVFFRADNRNFDDVVELAERKLGELNLAGVSFAEAPGHGELFPYSRNYVERTPAYVASHFGTAMSEQIFGLSPDPAKWQGPFRSAYGIHLVLLVGRADGGVPDFEEVADVARSQAQRAAVEARQDEAIQAIVDTYEVRRNLDAGAAGQP